MYSQSFKLDTAEHEALISLFGRSEFRSLERLIQYQVALYTDKAMASSDDRETMVYKAGASALKELTTLCKKMWTEAQRKQTEVVEDAAQKKMEAEKKSERIFK